MNVPACMQLRKRLAGYLADLYMCHFNLPPDHPNVTKLRDSDGVRLCPTWIKAFVANEIHTTSILNGLLLDPIPPKIRDLNPMEIILISHIIIIIIIKRRSGINPIPPTVLDRD